MTSLSVSSHAFIIPLFCVFVNHYDGERKGKWEFSVFYIRCSCRGRRSCFGHAQGLTAIQAFIQDLRYLDDPFRNIKFAQNPVNEIINFYKNSN